jgi:hypothetical protein
LALGPEKPDGLDALPIDGAAHDRRERRQDQPAKATPPIGATIHRARSISRRRLIEANAGKDEPNGRKPHALS